MKLTQGHLSLLLVSSVLAVTVSYADQANDKAQANDVTQAKEKAPAGEKAKDQPRAAKTAAKPGGKITVNGVTIPQARIDMVTKAQAAQSQGQPESPDMQANVREQLINFEVLAQEAIKAGLEKAPETQGQLEMARQQILVRAYQQHYVKTNPVKDETLKAEYDRVKGTMGDKEYKPQHILVEKEDEAKDIIAQLKKGGDFDKLAKEKTLDTGSKEAGGKLDWSNVGSFVKPFSDAMVKLEKGTYTQEPVKTQFGYHVIKLEDVRPLKAPTFDEVKENIRQGAAQQQFVKAVQELRSKAKVEEK